MRKTCQPSLPLPMSSALGLGITAGAGFGAGKSAQAAIAAQVVGIRMRAPLVIAMFAVLALWSPCPYMNGGKNATKEITREDCRPKYADQSEVKGGCSQGRRNGSAHALVA